MGLDGESGSRTPRPNPWCCDLECGEGPARREIQGPKIWPAEGQVAHYLWRLDNTEDLPRGRDDLDAAGANAPHPPRRIDFEAVRDAGSRRGHLAEHPVVTQRPIRGHVKRADTAVGADVAPRFFLKAPLVQPADRYVQDGLIGREGRGDKFDAVRVRPTEGCPQARSPTRRSFTREDRCGKMIASDHPVAGRPDQRMG